MKKALYNDHDHDHVELEEGTDVDEPVSAGFNEETGDPVEITVSQMKKAMIMIKAMRNELNVLFMNLSVPDLMKRLEILLKSQ